ncbi:MAG: CBS domain-containing protein [Deltaproteobacteria bacterium]|nr:CBS domain-containing protein [Deltaproteobacteria bacterium]MBW2019083.1 CBS domain-containing protein [Deltaproteobacteria bacterium]MBW2073526.1 CBS domain-containing protein [Deltaproteobacteria bacterium]
MKKLVVQEIIMPMGEDVVLKPSVSPEDKITDAIEVMLKNDLKQIAVTRGNTVLGMIRLEDAFKKIGLEGNLKSKRKRAVIAHGRKIIVDK